MSEFAGDTSRLNFPQQGEKVAAPPERGAAAEASYRTQLYDALAAALSPPPAWLASSGDRWPLTVAAARWAQVEPSAAPIVSHLMAVPSASRGARRRRYRALFAGNGRDGAGRPHFWLYESQWENGRILGPTVNELTAIYAAAGLNPAGAELADHASLELAFLAFLAEKQVTEPDQARAWRRLEQRFIAAHAGNWLPRLGRALAASGDPVYGPIGHLLHLWLTSAARARPPAGASRRRQRPTLAQVESCSLCGFCAQSCPTRALFIHETETTTTLYLRAEACIGCRKCEPVCDAGLLQVTAVGSQPEADARPEVVSALRRSARGRCRCCGTALVSEAELAFVRAQIGPQPWLDLCLACRAG